MHTPGIEGQCPRCLTPLMLRTGGWRGLVDMATLDVSDRDSAVYQCLMCGHYEDSVMKANKLAQHSAVTRGVHVR
jgi:hypothetical protein